MTVLILGRNGQVGRCLEGLMQDREDAVFVDRTRIDLGRPEEIVPVLDRVNPRIVVNAAAFTAVDLAETETELANQVNGHSVGIIADWCARNSAFLIHYSTDYVFPGDDPSPLGEEATTSPVNAYGASKLMGETLIRQSGCDHLILRTSWVYAAHGKNFMLTMLRLGAERTDLKIVSDQHGAPTSAHWIAEASLKLLERLQQDGFSGLQDVVHFENAGETTWHGFAEAIFEEARERQIPLTVTSVEPIATKDFPTPATRPHSSRLSTTRLTENWGIQPPDWRDALKEVFSRL